MKTCPRCGADFDPVSTRRKIDQMYGEDVYYDYYSQETDEVCLKCAVMEISADDGVGEEIAEDMGSGWDD